MQMQVMGLGLVDYDVAWALQNELASQIAAGTRPATLLLLEHPHVYTFGRSGNIDNLLWDEAERRRRGVAVRWVDRGGDVTYHGPGQLVGYPLLPLGRIAAATGADGTEEEPAGRIPRADYVAYVRRLERSIIVALARMGVGAAQIPRLTGVWVQPDVFSRCPRCRPEDRQKPAKIAAIGVKVDAHGVTRHGFALNVNPDMSYWDGIVPCGLREHPVVSIADLLRQPPEMAQVKALVAEAVGEVFGGRLEYAPPFEVQAELLLRRVSHPVD